MKSRKIASNYIFLPGYPLVKNGYVIIEEGELKELVDTGGQIREIQGLEFYGGLIVADYVRETGMMPLPDESLLSFLENIYRQRGPNFRGIAIVEGADLLQLKWKTGARFRKL